MNPRKRLTILHSIETGGPGGAETLVLRLASGLDPERFRSVVQLPMGGWLGNQLSDQGIKAIPTYPRRWFDPRPLSEMREIVRTEQVDLIHSHLPSQNFYASLAGKLTGRPSVITYHGPIELQQSRGLRGGIQLQTVRRCATAYLVVADQMAAALRQSGFRNDRIVRIYNGVDVKRYSSLASAGLRKLLGVNENSPIIGMVANIRGSKGYEYFINAAAIVCARFPEARFVSIGEPETELFEQMQKLVRELNIDSNFTFLGFRQDVPELLAEFSIFVLSSLAEGFPFAALEAMAAGKPSVMTRCGGPEEIAEDGVTGFLVPVADAPALAEKICALLESPDRARAMGLAAKEKVMREFTLEAMLRSYERLYEELCSGRRVFANNKV